jgi:hypothetical protein
MHGSRSNRRTLILASTAVAAAAVHSFANAQEDAEATIEAQETEIAELEEEVADLQTQVAEDPTPTSAPTREPVVEDPVELADGLVVLNYRFVHSGMYRADDDDKATWVVGEMQNNTDAVADAPNIQFTLLDDEGNVVGDLYATPILLVIEPGQVMPFQSNIFGDEPNPDEWSQEQLSLCSSGSWGSTNYLGDYNPSGLELEDIESDQTDDSLEVKGVVRNNRDVPAENVWIHAAIYDSEGRTAGWFYTYIDVPVPAGKTARFNFNSFGNPHDPVGLAGPDFTYELWVGHSSSVSYC